MMRRGSVPDVGRGPWRSSSSRPGDSRTADQPLTYLPDMPAAGHEERTAMTSTAGRTGQEGLSARVREATRADHDAARSLPYVEALLAGRLPRRAYVDLTAQHFLVYEALEQAAVAMRDDPVAGV